MRFYVVVRKGLTQNLCEPCASSGPVSCVGGSIGVDTGGDMDTPTSRCDRCKVPIAGYGGEGGLLQFSTVVPYKACPITKLRPIPEFAEAARRSGWSDRPDALDLAKCLLYAEDEDGKYYACITNWCKDYDNPKFMGMFFGDRA